MQVLSRGFLLYELEIFLASCRVGQLDCKTVGFFLKISKSCQYGLELTGFH